MTFNDLKLECKKHLNELILDDISGIKQLLGVYCDIDDYYWIYLDLKEGIYLSSCINRWIPLKGYIKDEDYENLESRWNMNLIIPKYKLQEDLLLLKRQSKLNFLNLIYKEKI